MGLPHFDGIIERLIGTMMEMVHELPGTTFSNPTERGDYDSQASAVPTVAELNKWLALTVASYHGQVHGTLKQTPVGRWDQGRCRGQPSGHGGRRDGVTGRLRAGDSRSPLDRSVRAVPSSTPAASPHLRRSPSAWPPSRPKNTGPESAPPQNRDRALLPAQIRQIWSRYYAYGASTTGSLSLHLLTSLAGPGPSGSTDPSRRCRGCFPPSPAIPGSGCPQFHPARCDGPKAQVSHLRSIKQRLVAHFTAVVVARAQVQNPADRLDPKRSRRWSTTMTTSSGAGRARRRKARKPL